MYYLISTKIKPDLLTYLGARYAQKLRQDEEWAKELAAKGWTVAYMIEVPDIQMLASIVESAPRLSLNHWGLPMQPDAGGSHFMICADNVRAILGNLEALRQEDVSDELRLLIFAIEQSPQFDLPINYAFVDEDGDELEITAWSEEEAKEDIRRSNRSRGELSFTCSYSSWNFSSPIYRGKANRFYPDEAEAEIVEESTPWCGGCDEPQSSCTCRDRVFDPNEPPF